MTISNLSPELRDLCERCIVRGDFTLHSGEKTDWLFDALRAIEGLGWQLRNFAISQAPLGGAVAGLELGGVLLAMTGWGTHRAGVVRKDGAFYPPDYPKPALILIDDVVTTGASLDAAQKVVEDCGWTVTDRLCVLDRSGGKVPNVKSLMEFKEPPC